MKYNNYMKKNFKIKNAIYIFFFLLIVFSGCELFTVGKKPKPKPLEISQRSPLGVVILFKTELDSTNSFAAVKLIASPKGTHYSADEKFELLDDLTRFGRLLEKKPVTGFIKDSVSLVATNIHLQLDYYKTFAFSTVNIDGKWFVTEYTEDSVYIAPSKFIDFKY
jgi:hypothetical protein